MGWNRSGTESGKRTKDIGNNAVVKRQLYFRLFCVALVIICLASLSIWFLTSRENIPSTIDQTKKQAKGIALKTPSLSTNKQSEASIDKTSLEWLKKNDPRYIVPKDAVRRPNGRLYTQDGRRILEEKPARRLGYDPNFKPVFNHQAEEQISRLLSISPGEMFVGNGNYGPKFVESLKQSFVEPTLITKDDDNDTRALKKQVNEVKADLKERIEAGEDVTAVMKSVEQEMRSLATFRENMKKELIALRLEEGVTEADYKDYVTAANKMLEDRGMKGLTSPKFVESQIRYLRERHKSRLEEIAAKEESEATDNRR